MEFAELFFQRYDVLYDFWLEGVWETLTEEQLRQCPHPRVNSIAWNLWHLTRVDDAGLNRFVVDREQVLDTGRWGERMNIPWRHNGTGMNFTEVDDLDQRVDLAVLHDYSHAVRERTRETVRQLDLDDLAAIVQTEHIRKIVIDEGLAHSGAEELIATYTGWTKGRFLLNHSLTHPYQHVGEIGVIASLLGIEW
ncbi:MAG: DinB family protein [Anaerolineales bacterium]